jgi:DMSO/TMAO reductase YedYZ heme-binding membrane subunit
VAAGLLILLMISGIGMVTGFTYRYFQPSKAWIIHRALGIALGISVAIHGIFLLLDNYIKFNILQVLVPFAATYKRSHIFGLSVGSIYVALGILAMYAIAITLFSSLGWIDSKKGLWKKLHYLNYFIIFAVFFHALFTGSDFAYGVFRAGWIFIGLILLLAIFTRLWRAGTLRKSQ